MAEGFRRAGIEFGAVFDLDKNACDSYEANLGRRPYQCNAADIERMLEVGFKFPRSVDLLVADPPCTPWSHAGNRKGLADERDMVEETVRIIKLLHPTEYLIGNVPGLDDSTNWHIVQRLLGVLAKEGYCVADFAQLDAASYGVPQHRVRPFWFGHLSGGCIRWPEATHGDGSTIRLDGIQSFVSCREALSVLPVEEWGRSVRLRKRHGLGAGTKPRASEEGLPAGVVTTRQNGDGNTLILNEKHPPSNPDLPAYTIGAKIRGAQAASIEVKNMTATLDDPAQTIRVAGGRGGESRHVLEPHSRHPMSKAEDPAFTVKTNGGRASQAGAMLEWPWEEPATTLQADSRIAPPGTHGKSWLSMAGAIVLSEKAAAILQGFPPDWKFCGKTKTSRWSQIGQAMPPPLAEAVARQIVARRKA